MGKQINILHLEDDPNDAELILEKLSSADIACSISCVQTRDEFIKSLNKGEFDIILSDYKLPMFDGISAMKMAKESCPEIPFIFVSGTLGEDAAIETLTQGATDYVIKTKLTRLAPAVKRAYEEIRHRRENRRIESTMKARFRILETSYTKDLSLDETCVMVLDEIESQTGSEIGFLVFIDEEKNTITLESWSSNTMKNMGISEITTSHYDITEGGLWSECIEKRKPIVYNDFASLSQKKVLPKGHVPLIRELVVPVTRRNSIVACIGVGNKQTDYDESDVQAVSLLGDVSWEIIRRKRLEEELRISDDRFRMAQAIGHIGNWEYNLQTAHFWGSDEAKLIYGFDPNQNNFSTDEVENCIPERMRVHQALVDLIEKELPYNLEFEINPINSSRPKIISSIAELHKDDDGNPLKVVGVIQDITERKRTLEELKESEERYRSLVEMVPEAIVVHKNGKIIYGNPAAVKLYGGEAFEHFIGMNVLEFVHPEYRDIVKKRTRESYEKRMPGERIEEKHIRLDGQTIYAEVTTVPIAFSGENATLLIIADITERKKSEKRIIQERENFYKILSTAPVGLLLIDSDMIIQHANNTLGAIVFREPASIIGERAGGGLGCVNSLEDPRGCGFSNSCPVCPLQQGLLSAITEEKTLYDKEIAIKLLINGFPQDRWLNVNIEPIHMDEKQYLIVAIDDITEKKMLEHERLANLKFLEGLDRVNRAIQGTSDLEQMMGDVLDVIRLIFKCDRAWLVHPCDPDSKVWQIMMEVSNPEYPGLGTRGVMEMIPEVAEAFHRALEAGGPLQFGPGDGQIPLPPILAEESNVKSYIAMAIFPKSGKPWEFGMHQCSHARVWTAEEERLFQEIGRRLTDGLTNLLMYRNVQTLLRELHHRTKNNMSVIISLLKTQAQYFDDPRWQRAVDEAKNRIHSMALVHQLLYLTEELSSINFKDYINHLIAFLISAYNLSSDKISIVSEMDDVYIELDYAVPCGLILNELITNALKYAFPDDRKGVMRIKLHRTDTGEIFFSVGDNGIGIPDGVELRQKGRMGIEIIYGLTEFQLKGQVEFELTQGVECQIVFSDNLYKKRI